MSGRTDEDVLHEALTELVGDRIEEARREAGAGGYSPTLWRVLEEGGFTTVVVPEHRGGSGGSTCDLATVLRVAGYQGTPVPLAEHNIAALLLAESGRDLPGSPLTVADLVRHPVDVVPDANATRATGSLRGVPWAGSTSGVVVFGRAGGTDLLGVASGRTVSVAPNIAGEPAADVELPADGVVLLPADGCVERARELQSLARSLQICGALRRVLALTVQYAGERTQFGRPIGAFQAVGHQLATLAGAVEQADAIVNTAVEVVAAGRPAADVLLAATVCTRESARVAITTGHQVHGAIGVTEEHELHHHTRRLMAWRDLDGSERRAALEFGRRVAASGPTALWRLLTGSIEAPA